MKIEIESISYEQYGERQPTMLVAIFQINSQINCEYKTILTDELIEMTEKDMLKGYLTELIADEPKITLVKAGKLLNTDIKIAPNQ